jgi:hypothetical protein
MAGAHPGLEGGGDADPFGAKENSNCCNAVRTRRNSPGWPEAGRYDLATDVLKEIARRCADTKLS